MSALRSRPLDRTACAGVRCEHLPGSAVFFRRLLLAASAAHLLAVAPVIGAELRAQVTHLPFAATIESVVDNGAIEGHPVSVVHLRTVLSVSDAIAAARSAWSREDPAAVLVVQGGPWRVVSLRAASGYRTLQMRAAFGGGSEGLLSIWSDRDSTRAYARAVLDPARLLPAGARVLRSLEGSDAGRRHRTLVAVAEGSLRWAAEAIETRALALGFERDPVVDIGSAQQRGAQLQPLADRAQARIFRRPGQSLAVTVHRHGERTGIVMHLTENAR